MPARMAIGIATPRPCGTRVRSRNPTVGIGTPFDSSSSACSSIGPISRMKVQTDSARPKGGRIWRIT